MNIGQAIVGYVVLSHIQLEEARMNEHLAEISGGLQSLPPFMTVSGVMENAKRDCMNSLFMYVRRQGWIQFQIDEETDFPNVIVRGVLYVGKGH